MLKFTIKSVWNIFLDNAHQNKMNLWMFIISAMIEGKLLIDRGHVNWYRVMYRGDSYINSYISYLTLSVNDCLWARECNSTLIQTSCLVWITLPSVVVGEIHGLLVMTSFLMVSENIFCLINKIKDEKEL